MTSWVLWTRVNDAIQDCVSGKPSIYKLLLASFVRRMAVFICLSSCHFLVCVCMFVCVSVVNSGSVSFSSTNILWPSPAQLLHVCAGTSRNQITFSASTTSMFFRFKKKNPLSLSVKAAKSGEENAARKTEWQGARDRVGSMFQTSDKV